VENLVPGERQLVEIARALSLEAKVIIFDEPTTSLTSRETRMLFRLIQQLKARGIGVIYISHTLPEVMQLCDSILVLRDGEVVGSGPVAEFTLDRLITLMVGRSISQFYPSRKVPPDTEPILQAQNLSQKGVLANVSFTLHRREILGIAGLMGAGRTELARVLFGLDPCAQGEVMLGGTCLNLLSPRQRVRAGLAFLTENRREEGLCLEAPIADNLSLVALDSYSSVLTLIRRAQLDAALQRIRQAVQMTPTARGSDPVKQLSGGNQQKVVLAKWLLNRPRVLILDEPTRGIDVAAKFEVHSLIARLAEEDAAILMISSEIEELIGMCDRILVMANGKITDTLERHEFDRERILRAALTARGSSVVAVAQFQPGGSAP